VALAPEVKLVGAQVSEEIAIGDTKLSVAVCELPLSVATRVTLWLPEMLPAVALKLAVAEPAGTVTVDAGTGSNVFVLEREIVVPPAGATLFSATVHAALAPGVKTEGLQDSEERVTGEAVGATNEIVTLCETPFRVARRVAFWLLVIVAAVALNVAVEEPAETVIVDTWPGRSATVLASEIVVPPPAGAWLRVTVHEALDPEVSAVGLQDKDVRVGPDAPDPDTPVPDTVPPLAEMASADPALDVDTAFPNAIAVLVIPEAIVKVTVATMPFWIAVGFIPQATQL
jgi:hypothetical protein